MLLDQLQAPQEMFRLDVEIDLELDALKALLSEDSRRCILTYYFRFLAMKDSQPAYLDQVLIEWFPHLRNFYSKALAHSTPHGSEASDGEGSEYESEHEDSSVEGKVFRHSTLFEIVSTDEGHFFRFFCHLDPQNKKYFAEQFCKKYMFTRI